MNLATTSFPHPAARARWLLALGLLATSMGVSAAKMYQWVDQNTGSVQLAGQSPPWYCSTRSGPRVRVYEHGKVIDDTACAALRSVTNTTPDSSAEPVGPHDPALVPAHAGPRAATAASQVEEFKALLEAWDREQVEQAPPATSAATPPLR